MQAPAKDRDHLRLELPSEPGSIKQARDAVAELAAQVGVPVADVKLAVSEAVSNAVVHAFRDRAQGTIYVRARTERGRLIVVIADNGTGMRPNVDSPGLGFGLSLITQMAGDVRFDSSASGLTVSMSFGGRS
jgi:serine/threonine-protein kinase RsbW/stage II sporulation protein AB (anti-sigma F factor)